MNKFLITLATIASMAISGVAYADAKISGFMQQLAGMGDDVDGGLTQKFTRFSFGADTTTDNGWTVGGSFAIEYGNLAAGGLSGYGPTSNSMYVTTDMGTLTIGGTTSAVTNTIPRVSNMIPGAGHDGGYQFLFDGGSIAANGVNLAEAYYAQTAFKVHLALPTVNGFSVKASYTPDLDESTAADITRANATISGNHGEAAEVAVSYAGEMDGMSYVIGVGSISGNSQGTNNRSGTQAANNDLSSFAGSIKVTMGDLSMGVHAFDNGDSFGSNTDADKASHSGYTVMVNYNMGNVSVGAGYAQEEKALGTRGSATLAADADAQAGNLVARDSVTMIGVGYSLGGGVNTFIQLSNNDHDDGDHATTEVDPQVIFAGISLGF